MSPFSLILSILFSLILNPFRLFPRDRTCSRHNRKTYSNAESTWVRVYSWWSMVLFGKTYNLRFVDRCVSSFRKRFLCSWPCDLLKRGSTSFLRSARFLSECQKHSREFLVIDGDQHHASTKYLRFPFRLISSIDSWKDSLLPPRLLISRIASALLRFLQFADPSAEAYAKFLLIVYNKKDLSSSDSPGFWDSAACSLIM